MEEIKKKLLDLLFNYYPFILAGISLVALLHWSRLKDSGPQVLKFVRKLSLFMFTVAAFTPYMKFTAVVNNKLISDYNLNYKLSTILTDYKGSDWADGLFSAASFFIYVGFILYLWTLEKKASAPPPEKPLKIEAKIGNIEPPKK